MRQLLIFVSVLLALAPQSLAAQAPTNPATSAVGEIHFTGSRRWSEAQLVAASGLKIGDAVTPEELQVVADAFARLGLFSRANFRYASRANKLVVQFEFEDAPTFPISFDNFPWFADIDLQNAIRGAVPLFDGTAPADGVMLNLIADAISKLLTAHGISGAVQHTLMAQAGGDDQDGNNQMIQFSVQGPQVTIGSLEYGDPLARESERLKDRNGDLLGKPFSRLAIEVFEDEQVRPLYVSAGHLKVSFGEPVTRPAGDSSQPQPLPSQLPLLLPIDPGPVFMLSGVTAAGNVALDAAAINTLLSLRPGQLADGMKLTEAWQRVEREYRRRGYLDVKIDPQPQFDDAATTVSYRLAISEGPQYHMHDLILTGLTTEASDAVLLRWELKRGAIANGVYMDDMLAKLEKPSEEIFGQLPVHYSKVGHWVRPDPATKTIDVLIDFQ